MEIDKSMLPKTSSVEKSIVFVTMHKAGSVFVSSVLADLARLKRMPHVDFAGEAFRKGLVEWEYCVERSGLLAVPGYFFGAFRGPYLDKIADTGESRVVAQVRDPRDCIVSLYFSYKFSHAKPGRGEQRNKFSEVREAVESTDIDTFAVSKASEYRHRMELIHRFVKCHEGALLLKYEDMISDFDFWYRQICAFLEVRPGWLMRRGHARGVCPETASGDPNAHRRQMLPGDHRRKLRPETISRLNETLGPVLAEFGYEM